MGIDTHADFAPVLPRRSSALAALEAFLPRAGLCYARERNYDFGPQQRHNVSQLSPALRVRLLGEAETCARVCEVHGSEAAEKFLQEVGWRTYWKGWLQRRPSVWCRYGTLRAEALDQVGPLPDYQRAIAGATGLAPFDAWARELVATGYLHNHARMWFASVWIFTLRLPWAAGADFFMRHLLDGDPASNTLGWRWVAGLQTPGKHYVATAENIAKYTDGRFGKVQGLAEDPTPLDHTADVPPPPTVWRSSELEHWPAGRVGLVIHEEDCAPETWLPPGKVSALAGILAEPGYREHGIAGSVWAFRQRAVEDALERAEVHWQAPGTMLSHAAPTEETAEALGNRVLAWAVERQLDAIVLSQPPCGFWDETLASLASALAGAKITLRTAFRPWDNALFPHATRGFFAFKQHLPEAVERARAGALT